MIFSELKNYINWENVDNYRLKTLAKKDQNGMDWFAMSFNGTDTGLFETKDDYFRLVELYKFLYENFKKQGNSEYSNACYA